MGPDGLPDLVPDGEDRVQGGQRLLKHHGDLVSPDLLHGALIQGQDVRSFKQNPPTHDFSRRAGNQPQGRKGRDGLSAPGLPHQADGLPRMNVVADPVHGPGDLIPAVEIDLEVFRGKKRFFRCHCLNFQNLKYSLLLSQLGVEGVFETLPEEVEAEDHDQNGHPRNEGQPGGVKDEALAVGKDVPPGGVRGRNPEAQETEARFRQDGRGDADGGGDQHRRDGVGHHVPEDDAEIAHPQGFGGADEILFPQGEKFGPHEPGGPHPAGESDDDHDVVDAGRQQRHHRQDEKEAGKAEHDVHHAHDEGVEGKGGLPQPSRHETALLFAPGGKRPYGPQDSHGGEAHPHLDMPQKQQNNARQEEQQGQNLAVGDPPLAVVSGQSPHEDAHDDGDAHRHEPHGEGDPGPLQHACEHVPPQIVGPQQVEPQGGDFVGLEGFQVGPAERGEQFFLEPHQGRIEHRVLARSQHHPGHGGHEKGHENDQPHQGQAVLFEQSKRLHEPRLFGRLGSLKNFRILFQRFCHLCLKPIPVNKLDSCILISTMKDMKYMKVLQHKTFDPMFQDFNIEINQEAVIDLSQFHIGQQLGFMNCFQPLDGLQFQNQNIFHKHIDSVPTIQRDPFVFHRKRVFHLEINMIQPKLPCKTLLICRFQKTRPKVPMNFNCSTNNRVRQIIKTLLHDLHVLHGEFSFCISNIHGYCT